MDELYDFLTGAPDFLSANGGVGPFGTNAATARRIELGDIVLLANAEGEYYHSLIICGFSDNDVLVCAQSDDALDRPLSTYNYASLRVIHIEGARLLFDYDMMFENIFNGTALP